MTKLADIVGQERAVGRIQRALASGRWPHALLFAGPEGVGRRTTALALAKTLLCENALPTPRQTKPNERAKSGERDAFIQACGNCDDCRMMDANSHPDFHLVYKELAHYHPDPQVRQRKMQQLGIDVIRFFLIEPAGQAPSRGRGKVFVVKEADLMSEDAQSALLKTLEEPPPGVTIVLLCHQAQQMLPTTRSRCSLVRFGPLPGEFVKRRLAEEEIEPAEAGFWSAFTDGSLGGAIRLWRGGMYEIKKDIVSRLAALVEDGDADFGEYLAGTMDKLANRAVREAKSEGDGPELSKLLASRRSSAILLRFIASAFRDALTLSVAADRPLVNADQAKDIRALAVRFEAADIAEIIEQISRYERLLWRNVNPKLVWDNVMVTCASATELRL